MRLEALFHFSFYLTLALAAACLALPSAFFLPWIPFFLVGMLALLFLAWRCDGAWVLSEMAANHLGVFIAVGAAGWILFQIPRSEDDLIVAGVNWPAGLLPHLAPLLMTLLVVKLFRPKRLPDYWVIQTMGLMMVTLAAVLADHHTFGLFVVLYFASLVWSLALYYPVRERALVEGALVEQTLVERALAGAAVSASHVPLFGGSATPTPVPWRLWGLPRAALWTGTIAAVGFAIFLAAPRQGQSQWNARQLSTVSSAAVNRAPSAGIDLNRIGTVELSEAPAFSVTVLDHEGRAQSAAAIGRWRTEVLEIYAGGRWYPFANTRQTLGPRAVQTVILAAEPEPAQVRDGEWLVRFRVKPSAAGGLVLAEPLDLDRGIGLGPRVNDAPQRLSFFAVLQGCDTFVPATTHSRHRTYAYSQVIRAASDNPASDNPASDAPASSAAKVQRDYASFLASQGAPGQLIPWTKELVQRLPRLSAENRLFDDYGRLRPEFHAKAAQALCDHLVQSGEYAYSLELRRQARDMDPTVDFLMNVKEGHCERYAGGLALMLRALGIRCRIVKGYLGGETDEQGQGIVRLSGAHTWVQALVPGETSEWRWLMLDPTPSSSTQLGALVSWWRWCQDNLLDTRVFWRQFVMEYTPEQQADALGRLLESLASKQGAVMIVLFGAVAGAGLYGRRAGRWLLALARARWTRSAAPSAPVRLYDDFLRLTARHLGRRPERGQTPREFAAQVAALLEESVQTREVIHIPALLTTCYYHWRFGGKPWTTEEQTTMENGLSGLRMALQSVSA